MKGANASSVSCRLQSPGLSFSADATARRLRESSGTTGLVQRRVFGTIASDR